MRSYVTIHLSIVLAVGVLVTGSIWARASWGHWFVWDEPMLVVFLIVFLLYATYQPLRFSIEDPEKQARYASVFAITAGAFVPLCFGAVRMAEDLTHPQAGTMTTSGPGSVTLTFLVSLIGMTLLSSRCAATRWPPRTRRRSCARCAAASPATTTSPPRPAAAPPPSCDAPPRRHGRRLRRRRVPRLPLPRPLVPRDHGRQARPHRARGRRDLRARRVATARRAGRRAKEPVA